MIPSDSTKSNRTGRVPLDVEYWIFELRTFLAHTMGHARRFFFGEAAGFSMN
jgi:hypothetical protein